MRVCVGVANVVAVVGAASQTFHLVGYLVVASVEGVKVVGEGRWDQAN